MKSSKVNVCFTALIITMTIVIVAHPNLIEKQIGNHSANILSSLNIE